VPKQADFINILLFLFRIHILLHSLLVHYLKVPNPPKARSTKAKFTPSPAFIRTPLPTFKPQNLIAARLSCAPILAGVAAVPFSFEGAGIIALDKSSSGILTALPNAITAAVSVSNALRCSSFSNLEASTFGMDRLPARRRRYGISIASMADLPASSAIGNLGLSFL
jgi:hypothetical protein